MILIIGPAYSGKREYARRIFSEKTGREALPEEILTEVQEPVLEEMDEEALTALAGTLCRRAVILTASETGAGIVPIEKAMRKKRENQGKLLSLLASRADSVIRVFYGIPEVIKGEAPV